LINYPWKGNVRELKDVLEKIVETRIKINDRRVINSSDLPEDILEEESTSGSISMYNILFSTNTENPLTFCSNSEIEE
jgi:transcriptional regulator with PAS, ATPase and Fis domain